MGSAWNPQEAGKLCSLSLAAITYLLIYQCSIPDVPAFTCIFLFFLHISGIILFKEMSTLLTHQVGLLNVDGFYNSLLSFIDMAVEEGFISQAARHIIISAHSAKELMRKLEVCINNIL